MNEIFESFTINILKLYKLVQKIKVHEMEEFGLKAIHVMCGYYLYKHPEGLTLSEITELTLEDKAAVSRAMLPMRKKGYVDYEPRTYNGKIVLTESGRALAREIVKKADRAVEFGSAGNTDEEQAKFYQTLGIIVDNLKSYYESLKNGDINK